MPLDVKIDMGGLEGLLSESKVAKVQKQVALRLRDVADPYVPYRTGALADNVTVDERGLTYTEEYAAAVYNAKGRTFSKAHHKDATDHWVEKALDADGGDIEELAAELLLKELS